MNFTDEQRAELQARLDQLQGEQAAEIEETNRQIAAAQQQLALYKQQQQQSIFQRAGRIVELQALLG